MCHCNYQPEDFTLSVFLLFGAIISAVDPVAVIAVFTDIKVNVTLFVLVFGEALLNDGVAIVLFQVFEKFIELGNDLITVKTCFLALLSFIIIAGGGLLIGVSLGFLTAFSTKFTHAMHELETVVILGVAYSSYLIADMLEMSGILAIVFCGFTMRIYVEKNVDSRTMIALHSITKMMALLAEMIIFVVLGITAAQFNWVTHFHWQFVLATLGFITLYRPIIVVILTKFLNRYRTNKISTQDMIIMSLSGLRGGIAFTLMSMANIDKAIGFHAEQAFVLTTIIVVFFTVFVQGTLCGPLVNYLKIEKKSGVADKNNRKDLRLNEAFHDSTLTYLSKGICSLSGEESSFSSFNKVNTFEEFFAKYLNPIFMKDSKFDKQQEFKQRIISVLQSKVDEKVKMLMKNLSDLDSRERGRISEMFENLRRVSCTGGPVANKIVRSSSVVSQPSQSQVGINISHEVQYL